MILFAIPKPDINYLANFFFDLFKYLTETHKRPIVFTNYYSSMEFYRPTGASVFCPEILLDENVDVLVSRQGTIEDETYHLCKQFWPNDPHVAQRNAFYCRVLPEIIEQLLRLQIPDAN